MPLVINISDDDVRSAERKLLSSGKEFDEERKAFIRNFETIDLQAVPGSGKTTALLAKLIILERKLPFTGGSGVLVLSHTNAAVDEIREKIERHCPRLFSYPNYIGTMQSFVDEFLAIPYYVHKFNRKHIRIDHELYNEKIKCFIEKPWLYKLNFDKTITDKVFYIKNNNEELFYNYRFHLSTDIRLVKKLNEGILEISKPRGRTRAEKYSDYTEKEKGDVYKWFFEFKKTILKSGILHFDDAYFLADVYLRKYPTIKTILQKRFSFVFVDEMQDVDTHQYNLLEKIFYDEGDSVSKIQRIGDKNQAIYNSVKATDVWRDRPTVLRLSGSQRLSKPIADVVKKFALNNDANFDIVGKNGCEIKPHIMVYDAASIRNIIPCFAKLLKDYGLANSEKPIKVICWNTDWKDDNKSRQDAFKLRLEDYYEGFKKEKGKPKQDYDNLKSYLLYYEKKKILEPLRSSILNAFLKILRLEDINTAEDRPYTKKKLIDFIRERDAKTYDEFNLNLYIWSMGIIQEKTNEVWRGIKNYVSTLLQLFDKTISESSDFINTDIIENPSENPGILAPTNYYKVDELEIEITSVHAVKGQTHCATLYLESCYHGKHESETLSPQFLGENFNSKKVHKISSVKMAYVGFSRPTDLLCVAIHKERFKALLSTIDTGIWEIVTVSSDAQTIQ